MRFGARVPHWGDCSSPEAILAVARRAEELGFDSVWLGDHVAVPVSDTTSARDRFYEILTVLGYLAGVTARVRLGTGVVIVPYRHPILAASALATADCLSGGRLVFGASAGWLPEEFAALGVPFRQRGARTDEYLQVIRYLWTSERPHSFHGRFVDFDDIKFMPPPLQRPHPPIWIGGNSRAAMRRAVLEGEAWFPLELSLDRLARRADDLARLAAEAGRREPPLLAMNTSVDFAEGQPRAGDFCGPPARIVDEMGRYGEAGLDYAVVDFPRSSLGLLLETMERFVHDVVPALVPSASR